MEILILLDRQMMYNPSIEELVKRCRMKRLFIAVPIAEALRGCVSRIISGDEGLRRMPVRWTPAGNLHLTVQFLGDVEEKRIPTLKAILDRLSIHIDPGVLRISGAGAFPNKKDPSILWLGFEENPALPGIRKQIDEALTRAAFEIDRKPFRAHLTLGRVQRDRHLTAEELRHFETAFKADLFPDSPLDHVTLFESRLRPGGPIYTGLYEKVLLPGND